MVDRPGPWGEVVVVSHRGAATERALTLCLSAAELTRQGDDRAELA
jgi:hypothetical protein